MKARQINMQDKPKQGRRRPPYSVYASDPDQSRGRVFEEKPSATRNDFQRDRDRIIHCPSFRRLKDKTQVFIYDEGDHFRTRLTHTIEVAQISRAIARSLNLDEDLAETLALAHDLGHPPFGHAGERALAACMAPYGGFDHNAQSLRVVTHLERAYAKFDGLNLTWETLEGLVKHNGPLTTRDGAMLARYAQGLPHAIKTFTEKTDLWLWSYASAEAQAAAIADDIAYDAHDVDDGLRAHLFTIDDLASVPLVSAIRDEVMSLHRQAPPERQRYELSRRVITRMIEDVIAESASRLDKLGNAGEGEGADAVRLADAPVIAFSSMMSEQEAGLKSFLYQRMYGHERVTGVMSKAQTIISDLFHFYFQNLDHMPADWTQDLAAAPDERIARRICDFIAGMTDRFALQEAARLTNANPELH